MGFPGGSVVKKLPAMQVWVWPPGGEDPLEKEVATYSSILSVFCLLSFIYLFLAAVGLIAVLELSLIATSGGYSLASVLGLLTAVVCLVAKHGLYRAGSVVVAYTGLVALPHCNLPGPGVNQCPLHWQADSQPLDHQGNPPTLASLPEKSHGQRSLAGSRPWGCKRVGQQQSIFYK